MQSETLLWLLPLPPLLSFFLIVLFANRNRALSHTIGVGAAALTWLGSMIIFFRTALGEGGLHHLGEHPLAPAPVAWLQTGLTTLNVGVRIDPLSAVTLFFVAWTVLMIFLYSVGYHNFGQPEGDHDKKGLPPHGATVKDEHGHAHTVLSIEPNYSRFFAFISLFAFGMFVLVLSDNLLTLFVGWEIMGLCSYLLIGFWFAKPSARAAAIKAFMTTRIGDVFMLLGLVYLYSQAGSLSYSVIFSPEVLDKLHAPSVIAGLSMASLIGILLFIGTVGKSAQFPLHVWLPDAMEGPTPVSAMIHAATMVSAGVYMVIRIFPIFSAGMTEHTLTPAMSLIATIGAFTALFAATIAVAQNDIKRVLAYSTISQLGFMVAAIGIGAYVAAVFHLITHAFFKALLFLGSGSVIHGVEHGVLHTGDHHVDPQDMMNMGGLRKKMPITFWTFLIGGMALSGFPFVTAGFWSKDEIFADAFAHGHYTVLIVLAIAAFLTAFYTMRQIMLTFAGEPRTKEAEHAHETPWTMTVPLMVLAFFAVVAGWTGIPNDFLGMHLGEINWIHGVSYTLLMSEIESAEITFSFIPLTVSLLVALGGLALGWVMYRDFKAGQTDPMKRILGGLHPVLQNKYYFDEIYNASFVRASQAIAEFAGWFDRNVIDNILHTIARVAFFLGGIFRNRFELPVISAGADRLADVFQWLGRTFRTIQSGKVQQYMIMVLVNVIAFGVLFYYLVDVAGR